MRFFLCLFVFVSLIIEAILDCQLGFFESLKIFNGLHDPSVNQCNMFKHVLSILLFTIRLFQQKKNLLR